MTLGLLGSALVNRAAMGLPGGLARATNGGIFHDDFNRPNEILSDSIFWLRTDGTGQDHVSGSEVIPQSPYGDAQTENINTVPASAMFQFNCKPVNFIEFWVRNQRAGNHNREGVKIRLNVGLNRWATEIEGNNIVRDSDDSSPGNVGVNQTCRLVIEDSGASGIKVRGYRALIGSRTDITSSLSEETTEISSPLAVSPVNSDICRITSTGTAIERIDEIMIIGGFEITVSGLPTGYKARVIGADLTGSLVAESGGIATINVEDIAMPAEGFEVTNASDVLRASFFSGSGIWGGDTYTFTE